MQPGRGAAAQSVPERSPASGFGRTRVAAYLLGGHPFASLGCDASAITSAELLAIALGS